MAATIYSVQADRPWRSSERASSDYSENEDGSQNIPSSANELPAPLRIQKPSSTTAPAIGAPAQSPAASRSVSTPVEGSRHRILNQVRSMLKPSRLAPSRDNVRWDEYSGELSEHGKAPQIKPSTYKPPTHTELEFQKRAGKRNTTLNASRDLSPVSALKEESFSTHLHPSSAADDGSLPTSPVSSISNVSTFYDETTAPAPVAVSYALPEETVAPIANAIKRKPVGVSSPVDSAPEQIDLQQDDFDDVKRKGVPQDSKSHFSWTTYATTRPSAATTPKLPDHSPKDSPLFQIGSRFSWSTAATSTPTPHLPSDSSPAIGIPPPIPEQDQPAPAPVQPAAAPVQSILSRSRPIQRAEREEWTPSPMARRPLTSTSSADPIPTTATTTPSQPSSGLNPPLNTRPKTSSSGTTTKPKKHANSKALPLPPSLHTPTGGTNPSRLETLLHENQDKAHQRANIERLIAELEKVESASPLAVTFAQVKDAQRKLRAHRSTLAEILMEQQEIGIAIARARRIEGEEANLWVSRVAVW